MDDYKDTLPVKALMIIRQSLCPIGTILWIIKQLVDMLDLTDLKLDTGIFSERLRKSSMYDGKMLEFL